MKIVRDFEDCAKEKLPKVKKFIEKLGYEIKEEDDRYWSLHFMEAGKYFKKKQKIFFWEREVNKFGHKFRFRTQDLEKAQVLIQVWYKPQQQTIKDAKKVAEYWEKLMGKGTATVQINTCPSG